MLRTNSFLDSRPRRRLITSVAIFFTPRSSAILAQFWRNRESSFGCCAITLKTASLERVWTSAMVRAMALADSTRKELAMTTSSPHTWPGTSTWPFLETIPNSPKMKMVFFLVIFSPRAYKSGTSSRLRSTRNADPQHRSHQIDRIQVCSAPARAIWPWSPGLSRDRARSRDSRRRTRSKLRRKCRRRRRCRGALNLAYRMWKLSSSTDA
mmetsp:Transcript_25761/g.57755  ORF Transcript_25761/g.57755 Transcript_25761/m.57755 type:complete len:210 (+) Transcript_25761:58-687(+)